LLHAACEWIATGNHPVDCAVQQSNGRWDVAEVISTCQSNLVSHLNTLCTADNIDRITVVCTQRKIMQQIRKDIANSPVVRQLGTRLAWELAETYMRRLWP
jgi:hypothetical protein